MLQCHNSNVEKKHLQKVCKDRFGKSSVCQTQGISIRTRSMLEPEFGKLMVGVVNKFL